MQSERWGNVQRSWQGSGFPLTIAIICLQFLSMILSITALPVLEGMIFRPPTHLFQPWRLLTYPFVVTGSFLSFLFVAGFTYFLCSSLERSWGTRNFAVFYFALTVISGVALSLGALLFKTETFTSYQLPLCACAVAWGLLNREESISFWFIPMKGIFISAIGVLILVFDYGQQSLLLIPFALAGCAAAYFWVTKRSWAFEGAYNPDLLRPRPKLRMVGGKPKAPKPPDDRLTLRDLNPLEWLARRRRRQQFEKLMRDD